MEIIERLNAAAVLRTHLIEQDSDYERHTEHKKSLAQRRYEKLSFIREFDKVGIEFVAERLSTSHTTARKMLIAFVDDGYAERFVSDDRRVWFRWKHHA